MVSASYIPVYAADYSTAAELKLMEGFPPPLDKRVTKATALQTAPFTVGKAVQKGKDIIGGNLINLTITKILTETINDGQI